MSEAERDARVRESLEEVALPPSGVTVDDFLNRYTHQLSGGQQQRVAIAMAFANRPHVIVCDEPTTGLDVTTQARVLKTVRELCQEHGVAALYVSHDLAVVAELADHVAVMYAGRIVERGPRDVIFSTPRHPYTRRLLRAVPDLEGKRAVLGIPGRAPLPGNRPGGCFFAPRCDLAIDKCTKEFPPPTLLRRRQAPGLLLPRRRRADGDQGRRASARRWARPATSSWRCQHVDASYGSHQILHDVDFEVRRNQCVALVGESGSGKTTTARCVAGLHHQYTGEIQLDGVKLGQAARCAHRRGPQADPVRVPEPVRVAEPAADDRPDTRAPAASVPARGRHLARDDRHQGRRDAWSGSRCRVTPPAATPTSCPAASASASRSPARSRPSRRCWSATRSPRRSTSRSRPRSSSCCAICVSRPACRCCSSPTTWR